MRAEAPRSKPSQRPRYRYVLARFHDLPLGFARPDLIQLLRQVPVGGEPPWLTRYNGEYAVLRVARGREKSLVSALQAPLRLGGGAAVRAEALSTSGSLAALHRRYRHLEFPR